jgi:hypothetical protein
MIRRQADAPYAIERAGLDELAAAGGQERRKQRGVLREVGVVGPRDKLRHSILTTPLAFKEAARLVQESREPAANPPVATIPPLDGLPDSDDTL